LSRFASDAFIPPYWNRQRFHVASEIPKVRGASVKSLPSLSIRSPLTQHADHLLGGVPV